MHDFDPCDADPDVPCCDKCGSEDLDRETCNQCGHEHETCGCNDPECPCSGGKSYRRLVI